MTTQQTLQTEEYKQTELGELPKDWSVVKLETIAKISSGGSAPQGDKFFHGKFPFIRVQHIDLESYSIRNNDLITEEAIKKCKLKLFPKGTIVFPKSGASIYSEKRAMLPFDAYVVSHLCTIQTSNKVNNLFLYFLLRNKKLAEKKAETYPTLNLSEIKEIQIPLPPLPEQQKIAYVLSTIQEAQEKTDNFVNSLKELKKSSMKHLFTYGAVSFEDADKVELKETEIGKMPKSWGVKKLGDVAKYINGYPFKPTDWKKEGKPIIRIQNLTGSQEKINYYEGELNPRYKVKNDDILISWSASLGVFKWQREEAWLNQHIFKVDDYSKDISKEFFYYIVGTQIEYMKGKTHGSTMHHITKLEFLNVNIPFPPLPEQQKIASILSAIDSKIEAEESKKKALGELFNSMLKDLMIAKLRVSNLEVKA